MSKVIWLIALSPALLYSQGFGKIKKNVTLERRLPAAVKMPGVSFNVKVSAEQPNDAKQKLAADKLQSMVETNLVRFNTQLQLNPEKPDTLITLRVLNCNAQAVTQYSTTLAGRNKGKQEPSGLKVSGRLTTTYQARTGGGGFLDAEPVDVRYEHEFNAVNGAISETKKLLGKIPLPGKHHQQEASDEPHTIEDVIEILVDRTAQRIAARLVNTNERVEIMLARGSLDQANRYAEAGQWTKFVEELETMPPMKDVDDDAYRLYNIGVGNEALGYKAETPASARRYFEQAVMQYRKAGEANPQEKYFIEPVNRIEVALEHYKQLTPSAPAAGKKGPTPPPKKGKNP